MLNELRIFYPGQLYPEKKSGGYLRTINLAKLASEKFKTSIYGIAEGKSYECKRDGINIIQEKKYKNIFGKFTHYSKGLISNDYSLMNSKRGFEDFDPKKTIFQLEGPYSYNLFKKKGIKKFVLDEQNVYWELSEFPNFDLKNRIYNKVASNRDRNIEINAIKEASHILTCSEIDKENIILEIPDSENKITIIPNCVDFKKYENYSKTKEEKEDSSKILFMGTLSYQPNTDALYNICNIIAPDFDEKVKFIIVGKNPPKIKHPSNVKFVGYVEDINETIFNSDICIAPLRYGGGTRLKILEYMAMGKPVISTKKGAEGIDYVNNKNIIIEDNIKNYAHVIADLLKDEKTRNYLGKEAIRLIKSTYDWQIYKKTLNNIYNEVLNGD